MHRAAAGKYRHRLVNARHCPDRLSRALAQCLTLAQSDSGNIKRLAVAASGGLDSTILTVYAADLARRQGLTLHVFHIHHGLQSQADRWQSQVHDLARMLNLPCHSLRVTVPTDSGLGIEAAARQARYDGLAQLARQVGVRHALLAHHRDDQAETVLLRLLRGTGPQGLAAMHAISARHGLIVLRPFLNVDKQTLEQAFKQWQGASRWQAVQDPSNADTRYARSALRTQLAPALDARWPAWRTHLARHAQLSAQVNDVLAQVTAQDFASLAPSSDNLNFSLAAWRTLSDARQALVLRYWLSLHGLPMPTQARLGDLLRQLRGLHALGHDRRMRVRHDAAWITCVRGRVQLSVENR